VSPHCAAPRHVAILPSLPLLPRMLDLSHNNLFALPAGLCGLTSLQVLNVSHNYLDGSLFDNVFARSMSHLQAHAPSAPPLPLPACNFPTRHWAVPSPPLRP
jgi:hypothetical protein